MAKVDYYVILECERRADHETLRRSYRRLAGRWHPDRNPDNPVAEERFKLVVEAWEVLGDPARRKNYDRFGHAGSPFGGPGSPGAPWPPSAPIDVSPEILMEALKEGIERVKARFARRRGQDIHVTSHLSFNDALRGGLRVVELPRAGADGNVVTRKVEIKIPASVGDGKILRWKGQGAPGISGGEPGDLYVIVRVKPHELFFFEGSKLYVRVPIRAFTPPSVDVPTPWGLHKLEPLSPISDGEEVVLEAAGGLLPSGLRAPLHVRFQLLSDGDPFFEVFERHVSAYAARRS